MLDSSVFLSHILSQTRQNISFLLSQNQISSHDAQLILAKIPTSPQSPQDGILTPPHSSASTPTPTTPPPPAAAAAAVAAPPPFTTSPQPLQQARAEWPYNRDAKEPNDLSFNAGDIIDAVSFLNADWWSGRLNGRQGLFPSNHVKLLQNNTTIASSSPPRPLPSISGRSTTPTPPISTQNIPYVNSTPPLDNRWISSHPRPPIFNPNAGPPTHRPDQPLFLRPGYA